jgi:hypothetical protein
MTRNAIKNTVECQGWGSKSGTLKMIKPSKVFDMKAKAAVLEQIQETTVIQPTPNISIECLADTQIEAGNTHPV